MAFPAATDTIVAIATPPGAGGIGVLRLSGPKAPGLADQVYRGQRPLSDLPSHQLTLGRFLHPQTEAVLDTGMVVWMRAPRSFTGEEVVEFHAHGGPLLLQRLLEVLLQLGARLAEPGEFTRRAFLNGKIDLLQAEAVGEMIHANSEAALRNARAQLEGRLSRQIEIMRGELLALLARVEAAIDFPEEDIEILAIQETRQSLRQILATLAAWTEKFQVGRLLREGLRVALVGRPNVGKSSLLNRLVGEERAIVHAKAGTTRDVIEGATHWAGVQVQLFDTAGIREGEEEVEREGIERAKRIAAQADLTLWVLDASLPLSEADRLVAASLPERHLLVLNKQDLGVSPDFQVPSAQPTYPVSAKSGAGIEALKQGVLAQVGLDHFEEKSFAYLNNARHQQALAEASAALHAADQALAEGLPAECAAADLRRGVGALETLVGRLSTEDILDKIFSDFCIGK